MKGSREKNPKSKAQFARGERVVIEALANRSGRASRYPAIFAQRNDAMSLVRFVKIADGKGRAPTRTMERNLPELGYMSEKQKQQARRSTLALQTWCLKRGLPQLMEVMHRRSARAFLRDLRMKGLARRTVENYRSVLSKLWEHVAQREAGFIRGSIRSDGMTTSQPLENPWEGLAVPEVTSRRQPPKSAQPERTVGRTLGLAKGPQAAAKHAAIFAYGVRPTLRDLSEKGIVSNWGIARALNEMGQRTPRNGLWNATAVRRLKERCGWDRE